MNSPFNRRPQGVPPTGRWVAARPDSGVTLDAELPPPDQKQQAKQSQPGADLLTDSERAEILAEHPHLSLDDVLIVERAIAARRRPNPFTDVDRGPHHSR